MCEGTLLGRRLISPEHLSSWCLPGPGGQVSAWQLLRASLQAAWASGAVSQAVSSSLRGSSLSLVMKLASVMFISQVRVPLKKRSFAGVCTSVCTRVHVQVLFFH